MLASICLVTNRPISYNPRLVKEADALHEAGYAVRVVAVTSSTEKKALDDRLMQSRAWRLDSIDVRRQPGLCGLRWFWAGLRQKGYLSSAWLRGTRHGDERAYSRYIDELAALAAAEPADLYVAHNLQALPVAHRAARKHEALLGFDAEDLHRGQFFPDEDTLVRTLTETMEEHYIPRCHHVTAASDGIAGAYADVVDIQKPGVVLNTFPLAERQGQTPLQELKKEKPDGIISLYWYSQVIGPNRGLPDVLRALPHLEERVGLTLRGQWSEGFESELRSLARDLGVEHRLRILPPAPPNELVERAAQHDIGLALEQPLKRNRDLCITNKVLVYLLAGLPTVATDTTGQRQISEDCPAATRLCPVGDPTALAEAVRSFIVDDASLEEAKAAAHAAGEDRYNWEYEKKKLLQVVKESLAMKPKGCLAGQHTAR